MKEKENPYADIINLPRPVSKRYPPLTMEQYAAQFSPFAALTGYNEAVLKAATEHEKQNK